MLRGISFPRWYWRPAFALLILAIGFLGARSSLGHRALNPAMVAFASDPLVNALTVNSSYSLFFAINQMEDEEDVSKFYGELPRQRILDLVRQESVPNPTNSAPTPCPARPSTRPATAASRRIW